MGIEEIEKGCIQKGDFEPGHKFWQDGNGDKLSVHDQNWSEFVQVGFPFLILPLLFHYHPLCVLRLLFDLGKFNFLF